ncbi:MAG: hypothetical protein JSV50_14700 [Desulfobacteraceae bacterium]|nr:MAG: hypothetical protein JSV50_14700 [Desulfobacteraceae bacterium]
MKSRLHKLVCFICITLVFAFALAAPFAVASNTNDQPEVRVHFKIRMKAGINYEESFQAFKELRDYFNAKFQPESNYGYIERSSEGNILHIFTDYRDIAAYEKAKSRYASDPVWRAKFTQVLTRYCEGTWESSAYVSAISFREEKAVSDLPQGQEGKIFSPVSI